MPDREPLVVAPFDAELFGHWWFEGPEFLDAVVRRTATERWLELTHLREFAAEFPGQQVAVPARSSWGEGGHLGVWLDESNAWMLGPVQAATAEMTRLARGFARTTPPEPSERVLRQAGRELLLAQASDWPFLVKMATAGAYPAERFRQHVGNFRLLAAALSGDPAAAPPELAELERRHPLFPDLDWRLWAK
jgi:1,4-alpha-glucan branching enzyme